MNESMVTVHANFMVGNEKKMNHMKEYGFWIATVEDKNNSKSQECVDYIPSFNATSGKLAVLKSI